MQTRTAVGKPSSPLAVKTPNVPPSSQPPKSKEETVLERRQRLLAKVQPFLEKARNLRRIEGGKPNKDYVWISTAPQRRQIFEAMGFTACRDPEVKTAWKQEDGNHVCGDAILYEVDTELREAYHFASELRAVQAMEGGQDEFLEFADKHRVPAERLEQEAT